jgi:hypothetical protein
MTCPLGVNIAEKKLNKNNVVMLKKNIMFAQEIADLQLP